MRTLNIAIVFIIAFFLSADLRAQNALRDAAEADELYAQEQYGAALPLYLRLLTRDPNNPALNYKTGVCYLRSRSQASKAIPYFEKAIELGGAYSTADHVKESDAPLCIYRLLGDACYATYRFDPAISAYEKYREILLLGKEKDQAALEAVNSRIEVCKLGKELKDLAMFPQESVTEKIKEKSGAKTTTWVPGDYSSTLSNDKSTMILTLKIPVAAAKRKKEESRYFDLSSDNPAPAAQPEYKHSGKATSFDSLLYAATVGASTDGQVVLSYRNENGNAGLYISQLRNDRWTRPERICRSSNSQGWEPSESLSADGNYLFFVSEREGGYGGTDIYLCQRLPGGEWSKARNLGPSVNTSYNETAPFIHPDGVTLYFSSNRTKPGSYEVFTTRRTGEAWSEPVNVGYPVNRNEEDIYEITERQKSRHPMAKGKASTDTTTEKGLLITVADEKKNALLLMKGEVKSADGKVPQQLRIIVTDNSNERVQGTYYTFKDGAYALLLPYAKNSNITFEAPGYLFHSEYFPGDRDNYFERRRAVQLQPLAPGSATQLRNIFFEANSSAIRPGSYPELTRLYQLMSSNNSLYVELSNREYARKDRKARTKLSKSRAEAVASWLTGKGIARERIAVKGTCSKPGKKKIKGREPLVFSEGEQVLELRVKEFKATNNIKQ